MSIWYQTFKKKTAFEKKGCVLLNDSRKKLYFSVLELHLYQWHLQQLSDVSILTLGGVELLHSSQLLQCGSWSMETSTPCCKSALVIIKAPPRLDQKPEDHIIQTQFKAHLHHKWNKSYFMFCQTCVCVCVVVLLQIWCSATFRSLVPVLHFTSMMFLASSLISQCSGSPGFHHLAGFQSSVLLIVLIWSPVCGSPVFLTVLVLTSGWDFEFKIWLELIKNQGSMVV